MTSHKFNLKNLGPAKTFKAVFLMGMAFFFLSCTTVNQDIAKGLQDGKFYKRDMQVKIDGHWFDGVLVLTERPAYKFKVKAKGSLDLFTMTSCHKDMTVESVGGDSFDGDDWDEGGFFSDSKQVELKYSPDKVLEAGGLACPLRMGGYEKSKGRHSWAFIDFEHSSMKAKAQVKCNGKTFNATGVSACQSRVGLIQQIKFDTEMLTVTNHKCSNWETVDEKTFRIKLSKGECTYRFKEKLKRGYELRITTIGYESILVRGKK